MVPRPEASAPSTEYVQADPTLERQNHAVHRRRRHLKEELHVRFGRRPTMKECVRMDERQVLPLERGERSPAGRRCRLSHHYVSFSTEAPGDEITRARRSVARSLSMQNRVAGAQRRLPGIFVALATVRPTLGISCEAPKFTGLRQLLRNELSREYSDLPPAQPPAAGEL